MKRDYLRDHQLRKSFWASLDADDPRKIAYTKSETYSKAHKKDMRPEPVTKIDPNSPEGKAIAARFNAKVT